MEADEVENTAKELAVEPAGLTAKSPEGDQTPKGKEASKDAVVGEGLSPHDHQEADTTGTGARTAPSAADHQGQGKTLVID